MPDAVEQKEIPPPRFNKKNGSNTLKVYMMPH